MSLQENTMRTPRDVLAFLIANTINFSLESEIVVNLY
jgi:hypothetical protein